jgi:phosphate transport system substrate-binding protein
MRGVIAAVFVASFAMLLAACGGDDATNTPANTTGPGTPTATSGPAQLSGRVEIDGSSTVFPITEAMAEEFRAVAPDVQVTVGISGTGGGFSRFCAGETDVSDASRPIKQSEADKCAAANIEFIELPVAYDGLAVMVNPQNDWVDCLTVEELHTIWAAESEGTITNWSQVREGFPDRPISLYGPGTDSGTYDYFVEAIVPDGSRGDFQASEDDNVLVQGISTDQNAIGFFGLAYYEENADRLKLIGIDDENPDNGAGCIEPSTETVEGGTYRPLSRPLFIYVGKAAADEKPQVEAFVDFYLTPENAIEYTAEVGYIPFPESTYDLINARWEARKTGHPFTTAPTTAKIDDVLRENQ